MLVEVLAYASFRVPRMRNRHGIWIAVGRVRPITTAICQRYPALDILLFPLFPLRKELRFRQRDCAVLITVAFRNGIVPECDLREGAVA